MNILATRLCVCDDTMYAHTNYASISLSRDHGICINTYEGTFFSCSPLFGRSLFDAEVQFIKGYQEMSKNYAQEAILVDKVCSRQSQRMLAGTYMLATELHI